MSEDRKQVKRALISVYDKTGLEDLARALGDRVSQAGKPLREVRSTSAPHIQLILLPVRRCLHRREGPDPPVFRNEGKHHAWSFAK